MKKRHQKILSVILALTLLLSMFILPVSATESDNYNVAQNDITPGETISMTTSSKYNAYEFNFVPEKDMTCEFTLRSDAEYDVFLLDKTNDTSLGFTVTSSDNSPSEISGTLISGHIYTLSVTNIIYFFPDGNSFSVSLDEIIIPEDAIDLGLSDTGLFTLTEEKPEQFYFFEAPESAVYSLITVIESLDPSDNVSLTLLSSDIGSVYPISYTEPYNIDECTVITTEYELFEYNYYTLRVKANKKLSGDDIISGSVVFDFSETLEYGSDDIPAIGNTESITLKNPDASSSELFRFSPESETDYTAILADIVSDNPITGYETPFFFSIYNSGMHLFRRGYFYLDELEGESYYANIGEFYSEEVYYIMFGIDEDAGTAEYSFNVTIDSMENRREKLALTDNATGITVRLYELPDNAEALRLEVSEITDPDRLAELAESCCGADEEVYLAYDIHMYIGEEEYIPDIPAEVDFPANISFNISSVSIIDDNAIYNMFFSSDEETLFIYTISFGSFVFKQSGTSYIDPIDDAKDIYLYDTKEVSFSTGDETVAYRFIPAETQWVKLTAGPEAHQYGYAYILDEKGRYLDYEDDHYSFDVNYKVTEGETYYYIIRSYENLDEDVSFDIQLLPSSEPVYENTGIISETDENINVLTKYVTNGSYLEYLYSMTCDMDTEEMLNAYQISFTDDNGDAVVPEKDVAFSIPCNTEEAKLFYVDSADTYYTDLNGCTQLEAAYDSENGMLLFSSNKAGYYVVVIPQREYPPAGSYKLGDANGDGIVDLFDVSAIQRSLADLNIPTDPYTVKFNGDVDGNGEIEIIDAAYIQRWIAQIKIPYNVGENTAIFGD